MTIISVGKIVKLQSCHRHVKAVGRQKITVEQAIIILHSTNSAERVHEEGSNVSRGNPEFGFKFCPARKINDSAREDTTMSTEQELAKVDPSPAHSGLNGKRKNAFNTKPPNEKGCIKKSRPSLFY